MLIVSESASRAYITFSYTNFAHGKDMEDKMKCTNHKYKSLEGKSDIKAFFTHALNMCFYQVFAIFLAFLCNTEMEKKMSTYEAYYFSYSLSVA